MRHEAPPVDYVALHKAAMLKGEADKRPPVPRVQTTSTGKSIPEGTVIVGSRDFCPEG